MPLNPQFRMPVFLLPKIENFLAADWKAMLETYARIRQTMLEERGRRIAEITEASVPIFKDSFFYICYKYRQSSKIYYIAEKAKAVNPQAREWFLLTAELLWTKDLGDIKNVHANVLQALDNLFYFNYAPMPLESAITPADIVLRLQGISTHIPSNTQLGQFLQISAQKLQQMQNINEEGLSTIVDLANTISIVAGTYYPVMPAHLHACIEYIASV